MFGSNIIIVQGMPQNGKSTFAKNFCNIKQQKSKPIHIDLLFENLHGLFPEEKNIRETFNIYQYVNHPSFNATLFLDIFRKEIISTIINQRPLDYYVIEGYVCEKLYNHMKTILKNLGFKFIYNLEAIKTVEGYGIFMDNKLIGISNDYDYNGIIQKLDMIFNANKRKYNIFPFERF